MSKSPSATVTEDATAEAGPSVLSLAWLTPDRFVAGGIFALALVVRLLHLHEIAIHDPFYTIASVDGAIYDEWARSLLAGEGLGEGVLFLGPLYPIFVASVYGVFGESLPALKLVQAVLGSLSCVLVWGVARSLFDRRVAALSGLAMALYRMHVFYGGTVMIVNLQVSLVVGLVWASILALRQPGFARWALCGLLVGLSVLARQTVLLVAPILALWILFGMEGPHRFTRRLAWATTFGALVLALVLPFTLHNYVEGDDLVLLNSTGGANFYMGNQREADGTWQVPSIGWPHRVDNPRAIRDAFAEVAREKTGRELAPSEVSAYWLGRGLDEIRADPGGWIALELRKLGLFVNAAEVWNNRSIDVSERFSWILRLPLVGFGAVAPLALLGLALCVRRWREILPVLAVVAAYLSAALLFFVLSRYRMPVAALLIPFAAYALVEGVDRARERAWTAVTVRAAAVALLAVVVHLPLVNESRMQMAWYNVGNKYRELERWDEAIAAYATALEENPRALSTWNNLALTYELGGDRDAAISAWQRVAFLARRSSSRRHVDRAIRHIETLRAEPNETDPTHDGSALPASRPEGP